MTSSHQSSVDPFLMELFRQEVQTHTQTLDEGLVQLEHGGPAPDQLERLMRAAHSIKGAARVVGVQPAVELAHAMEECLVQAQRGKVTVTAEVTDMLLQGVDLLRQLAEATGPQFDTWWQQQAGQVQSLVDRLSVTATGQSVSAAPKPTPPADSEPPVRGEEDPAAPTMAEIPVAPAADSVVPVRDQGPREAAHEEQRVVRVTALNLTRLMGLAGESLVEARWLRPFADSLLHIRRRQAALSDTLNTLTQALNSPEGHARAASLVSDLKRQLAECQGLLARRMDEFANHSRKSDDLNSRLYRQVIASRMRPFRDGAQGLARLVRDLARQLGKQAILEIRGAETDVDRDILEKLDAPLNHILRNAMDHGVETPEERLRAGKPEVGRLLIHARHAAGMLAITISDDGRGIDLAALRRKVVERKLVSSAMAETLHDTELLDFLFLPGFSTAGQVTEVSGRGVGLDIVHTMVHSVGGQVRIQTELGKGTSFHLELPITLSVIRAVLVEIAGEPYALPHNQIDGLVRLPYGQLKTLQNRQFCDVNGRNVGLVLARQLLELPGEPPTDEDLLVILFRNRTQQYGLVVDRLCGEHDLVVRPLDGRLGKVPNISAAAISDDGEPVLILDIEDVRRSLEKLLEGYVDRAARKHVDVRRKRVLVVDDSITVREVERQLLVNHGYEVEVAVDGMEGWNRIREGGFDLVISDIDMPRMNGIELVRRIKQDSRIQSTPVVIVSYKDRPEDRRAGLEAGANYYLTKSSFHDESLLQVVEELIGAATS